MNDAPTISRTRRIVGTLIFATGTAAAIIGSLGMYTGAWPGVAPLAAGLALYFLGGRILTGGWSFWRPFTF